MTDELPTWYADLDAALALSSEALQGAPTPGHAMRFMTAATHNPFGFPQVRLLTVRAFEPALRRLTFFSDVRTPKMAQLDLSSKMQLLAYDPEARLQLRMDGEVEVISQPEPLKAAWEGVPLTGRRDYMSDPAPGFKVSDPQVPHVETDAQAFENFTVLYVTIQRLDWLYLHSSGNRRAEFSWVQGRSFSSPSEQHWLVP